MHWRACISSTPQRDLLPQTWRDKRVVDPVVICGQGGEKFEEIGKCGVVVKLSSGIICRYGV